MNYLLLVLILFAVTLDHAYYDPADTYHSNGNYCFSITFNRLYAMQVLIHNLLPCKPI